jgi:hypothetical protein
MMTNNIRTYRVSGRAQQWLADRSAYRFKDLDLATTLVVYFAP